MLFLPEIMVHPKRVDFREQGHNEFILKHTEFALPMEFAKMLILTTSRNEKKSMLPIFILSNPFLNMFVINIMKTCPPLHSHTNQ